MSKTVFVSGYFNVLHPGHLRLLRFAKQCGDKLIVGVYSNEMGGGRAYIPEQLRLEGVQSNSWVDEAFIINNNIEEVLRSIQPDTVVKGKEHENQENVELDILKTFDGKLVFSSGESVFSSVDLIKREMFEPLTSQITVPENFKRRHDISSQKLVDIIGKFSRLKICVIGDLIVDEYITCQPLGMSQEDPTIVVTPIDSISFLGGAGIVAAHASSLGAQTHFISVVGCDAAGKLASKKLLEAGVNAYVLEDENRPTSLKKRFRSKGKSLLRVSHLHKESISRELQATILSYFQKLVPQLDLLVFSDFNYGVLAQELVDSIIKLAKENGVCIGADSQSSSQVGDISRFKFMDLITPTELEARISTRNHESGLVVLAEKLARQASAKNVLLKLGEEGLLTHASHNKGREWSTDRIEALNAGAKDVAGAGDSLLITSLMSLASQANIWEASLLGSIGAAIQVSRVGNIPLKVEELMQGLRN